VVIAVLADERFIRRIATMAAQIPSRVLARLLPA
jgi:hypothetical protein